MAIAFAAAPVLAGAGLLRGHDLVFELVRIAEFERALADGVLRPRWAANLAAGYGYPIFDFFPPVFLYLASLPVLLGGSVYAGAKFALTALLSVGVAGSHALGREVGGQRSALAAGFAFAAAPYVMHDVNVRNAWSETTALCLAPGVLALLIAVVRRPDSHRRLAATGLALGALGMAHNLSAYMLAPLLVVVAVVGIARSDRRVATARSGVLAGVLSLGVAATFLVSIALLVDDVHLRFDVDGQFGVLSNLLSTDALLSREWWPSFAFCGLGVVAGALGDARSRAVAALIAVLLVLCCAVAAPIWQVARPLHPLMFPWRLLVPATLLSVLAFALWAAREGSTARRVVLLALLAVTAGAGMVDAFDRPRLAEPGIAEPDRLRLARVTTTVADEYMPATVEVFPERPAIEPAALPGGSVEVVARRTHDQAFLVSAPAEGELLVRTFAFPGWRVQVDGRPVEPRTTRRGTFAVPVPLGESLVELRLRRLPGQRAADLVSLLSFLVGVTLLVRPRRRS